jgi:hypothetical protein
MNQQRPPRTDAMFETESPETQEQLDEFERRLKAARPQPAHLDMAVLQRLAASSPADPAVERPADQRSRAASRRQRRMRSRVLVIAGSWACGAAAGALVMFALMNRVAPENALNHDAAHRESSEAGSIAHDAPAHFSEQRLDQREDSSPNSSPFSERKGVPRRRESPIHASRDAEAVDASAAVFTSVLDPLGNMDSNYLQDGPTLQAGTYLKQQAERSMWPFAGTIVKERSLLDDDESGRFESWTESKLPPKPEPAITPRELMREFLEKEPGTIL